ncbi:MAG TPA: hypothetical protein VK206_01145, partial [Anaerolineales bacterium]|nr:hypothetical protein [Anaerolineales bacterium]
MSGINSTRCEELSRDFLKVMDVLAQCPEVEKTSAVPGEEFARRQAATWQALERTELDVGFVFSDEHYNGDVPYLGGNTNITIEQVAGVIGKDGFHVIAGLEGGYVSEQLAGRANAQVHKAELLQLADEKYPIRAERIEDILDQAAGKKVRRIGLLTPRQVVPCGIVEFLEQIVGKENVVDAQELYQRI